MFASRRWQHFFSIFFVSPSFPNCVHYDDSSQSKPCLNWPPAFQRNQRFVTQVRVDVLVLSSGGNLLDSLALALCAVLSETLLPKARCNLVNPKKIAPKKTPRIYICSKIYAIKVLKISPNSERAWGGMCWTSNPPQQNPQEVAVGKGFGGDALVTGGGHWGHGRRWRGATEGGEPLEGWGEVVVRDKMVGMGLNYLNTPKNYSSPNWILFKGFSNGDGLFQPFLVEGFTSPNWSFGMDSRRSNNLDGVPVPWFMAICWWRFPPPLEQWKKAQSTVG